MKIILFPAAALLFGAAASAQSIGPSTINAAGGSATVSGQTHEWSIGEAVRTTTATGAGVIVTEGVLQPTFQNVGVGEKALPLSGLQVYPNPAEDRLFLQPSLSAGTLTLALVDAAGRSVASTEALLETGTERQEISIKSLAVGTYVLRARFQPRAGAVQSAAYKVEKVR